MKELKFDGTAVSYSIPKKLAMINDIAGYGRCSATESLPIISAMRISINSTF